MLAWTYKRPRIPGDYWWQRPGRPVRLVRLYRMPRRRRGKWCWQVTHGSIYVYDDHEAGGGRWAGPILPPADEPWPAPADAAPTLAGE